MATRLSQFFDHDIGRQAPIAFKQVRAMARADATPFLASMAGQSSLVVSAEFDRPQRPSAGRVSSTPA